MKNKRKIIVALVSLVFIVLATACDNSSDELSAKSANEANDNNSEQEANGSSDATDSSKPEKTEGNEADSQVDASENASSSTEKEEAAADETTDNNSANTTASTKEEYMERLAATEETVEGMPDGITTIEMEEAQADKLKVWDDLLNEIYGVLEQQLTAEEMELLREEQREWVTQRDEAAQEASLEHEGGTLQTLSYVTAKTQITKERCYEFVESYMK